MLVQRIISHETAANRYFRYLHTDKNLPGEGGEGKKRHADEGATMPGGERAALNKGSHEVKRKKKGKEEKKRKKKGEKDGNLSR